MSGTLADLHFLRPAWLLLLLALPFLVWWSARRFDTPSALSRLVDASLLPHLLDATGRPRRWPMWLPALAWLLATLALAGPAWERLPQPLYGQRSAQVVVVSLSPRMLARDMAPDRLARARYKVLDLFAANRDGQNGLVAYAGAAFTVAPLTADAGALTDLLEALAPDVMPAPGDDAAQAIDRGVALLRQGGARGGSLVLVTDAAGDTDAVGAARRAHHAGVRVSVLGVGDAKGAPVPQPGGGFLVDAGGDIVMARRDDAGLAAIAAAGGGRYVPMRSDHADIDALAGELHAGPADATTVRTDVAQWRDRGAWLLLPLLPLALLAFRRGWLLALPLLAWPLVPVTARAADPAPAASAAIAAAPDAAGWGALWRTPDQRAARALAAGDARQAARLAHDPALRGAAAYRAGDYAAAAKAFAEAAGRKGQAAGDADYNLGNALASQGRYREAIDAYARALRADPGNADAAANRKAVEDWLRRQQSPSRSPSPGMQGSGREGGTGTSVAPQVPQPQEPSRRQPPKPGQDSPSQSTPGADGGAAASTKGGQGRQSPQGDGSRQGDAPADADAAAHDRQQAERAREAVKQQMDRELGGGTGGTRHESGEPYALGAAPAHAGSSGSALPASMQQALQRVPDDPGGLLRRKFQLEYQRRQGGGGSP